jgi:cell division protein FtsZ
MTLEEVNNIGELVTESLDDDANVIWGARVREEMQGKLTVMTIMTGVKSPWILGKQNEREVLEEKSALGDELGIRMV